MKSTTSKATGSATQRDISVSRVATNVASGVTITAAAGILGVTVRTVQRRLDSGVLRSIERGGRRLVCLDSDATPDATEGDSQRDTVTRHTTPNVATRDSAQNDMTTRYVAQIEAENRFLRSQVEEGNRNAAELRAALRKALEATPRALTMGAAESAPEATKRAASRADEQIPVARSNGNGKAPERKDAVDFDEIEALIYQAFK